MIDENYIIGFLLSNPDKAAIEILNKKITAGSFSWKHRDLFTGIIRHYTRHGKINLDFLFDDLKNYGGFKIKDSLFYTFYWSEMRGKENDRDFWLGLAKFKHPEDFKDEFTLRMEREVIE